MDNDSCGCLALGLVLAIGVLGLLITDNRVLVDESKVRVSEAPDSAIVLRCKYFTGRSFKTTEFWYSENNMMGRDQCPFLLEPHEDK